jgi:phosphatidylserine decarboxylase
VKIARGGGGFIGAAAVIAAVAAPVWGGGPAGYRWPLAAAALALLFIFLWFFRDPARTPHQATGEGSAVAPADGRVLAAGEVDGRARLITYLSLFDVHVVRLPLAALIRDQHRERGGALPAPHARAGGNARLVSECETATGPMTVTQVTGLLTRRIVPYLRPGQRHDRGSRLGLIRFGSRVELDLPPGYRLVVGVGDRLQAGHTVIAEREAGTAEGED